RKHLDRLEMQGADLRDFAARMRPTSSVKWSLSDVSCWMSEERFHDLMRVVVAGGPPGSRFCYRNFAARRELPRDLVRAVSRMSGVCDGLNRTDSSVIYRLEVGCACGSGIRGRPGVNRFALANSRLKQDYP